MIITIVSTTARQILKDYIDGKIPHFELPPSVTGPEVDFEQIAGSESPTTSAANESVIDDLDEEDDDAVDPAESDMRDVLDDLESFDLGNGGSDAPTFTARTTPAHMGKGMGSFTVATAEL